LVSDVDVPLDCQLDRDGFFVFASKATDITMAGHNGDVEQSLAGDGATSNFWRDFNN